MRFGANKARHINRKQRHARNANHRLCTSSTTSACRKHNETRFESPGARFESPDKAVFLKHLDSCSAIKVEDTKLKKELRDAEKAVRLAGDDLQLVQDAKDACSALAQSIKSKQRRVVPVRRTRGKRPERYADPAEEQRKKSIAAEQEKQRTANLAREEAELAELLEKVRLRTERASSAEHALAYAKQQLLARKDDLEDLKTELSSSTPRVCIRMVQARPSTCCGCSCQLPAGAWTVYWRGGRITCTKKECRLLPGKGKGTYEMPLTEKERRVRKANAGKRARNRVTAEHDRLIVSAMANKMREIDGRIDGKGFKLYATLLREAFFRYNSHRFLAQTGDDTRVKVYVNTSVTVLRDEASMAKHRFLESEWYQRHICMKCRHGSIVADGCEKIFAKTCKGFYKHIVVGGGVAVLDKLTIAQMCNRAPQRGNQYQKTKTLCSRCIVLRDMLDNTSQVSPVKKRSRVGAGPLSGGGGKKDEAAHAQLRASAKLAWVAKTNAVVNERLDNAHAFESTLDDLALIGTFPEIAPRTPTAPGANQSKGAAEGKHEDDLIVGHAQKSFGHDSPAAMAAETLETEAQIMKEEEEKEAQGKVESESIQEGKMEGESESARKRRREAADTRHKAKKAAVAAVMSHHEGKEPETASGDIAIGALVAQVDSGAIGAKDVWDRMQLALREEEQQGKQSTLRRIAREFRQAQGAGALCAVCEGRFDEEEDKG